MKWIELTEIHDGADDNTSILALNAEGVSSLEKNGAFDGPTTITMRSGVQYIVEESIATILARINS